uniref:Ovule protein n=1 Tax=Heterorhabditis bacteriophora TaxID=37862 RepID=A0A1I7W5Y5_HETBA
MADKSGKRRFLSAEFLIYNLLLRTYHHQLLMITASNLHAVTRFFRTSHDLFLVHGMSHNEVLSECLSNLISIWWP